MGVRWTTAAPRAGAVLLAATLLAGVPAKAASAAPPPAAVTGLAASLGPHGLVLSWNPSGSGTPVVRDVTGLQSYGPTSGRAVAAQSGSAYDTGFTNTADATYAVWSADSDGTLSNNPAELSVSPLPPLATTTVLDVLPAVLTSGRSLLLKGHVTRGGLPLPGARVAVLSRVGGNATATTIKTLTSGVDGSVSTTYVPQRTRTYQLVLAADSFSTGSSSAIRTVALQARISAAWVDSTLRFKQVATLKGAVSPNLAGRSVAIQRWYAGAWRTVAHRTLKSSGTYSTYSYSVTPSAIGTYGYRAVLPATIAYRGAISPGRVLTVSPRTLYQGVSGPDVLALEKRLAALHYVVGAVDGYYDANLRHAVQAFQKVERLSRTGKWSSTERTRVLAPRGFTLRYKDDRLTAEIDITRQVMVLARGGVIQTIVDISSGSEDYYYQDGVRYVAHTPRGVYSVYRKIDGIRVSKLGELYRPSYFYKGWAIHGSGSVPTYPASHGCIRITNYVADKLFTTLKIGTRVAVYD